MITYQALYQNEIRAVELTINDQDGIDFAPSGAYAAIETESGDIIVAEQAAMVSGNQIYTVVGIITTATIGKYRILWRILKDGYTYRHATDLEILSL